MDNKLCLEGEFADQFMKARVGDRMPIKLDAVVVGVGERPDMEAMPMSPGNKTEPKKKPYVEFVLRSVNGKGEKESADEDKSENEDTEDYAHMESSKFEKVVAKNRGY